MAVFVKLFFQVSRLKRREMQIFSIFLRWLSFGGGLVSGKERLVSIRTSEALLTIGVDSLTAPSKQLLGPEFADKLRATCEAIQKRRHAFFF